MCLLEKLATRRNCLSPVASRTRPESPETETDGNPRGPALGGSSLEKELRLIELPCVFYARHGVGFLLYAAGPNRAVTPRADVENLFAVESLARTLARLPESDTAPSGCLRHRWEADLREWSRPVSIRSLSFLSLLHEITQTGLRTRPSFGFPFLDDVSFDRKLVKIQSFT